MHEDDPLAEAARQIEVVARGGDQNGAEHAAEHLRGGGSVQMRVIPVNTVGMVGRQVDFVLAILAGLDAGIRAIDHVIAIDPGTDFLGIHMQAMKMQVGAVLVIKIA